MLFAFQLDADLPLHPLHVFPRTREFAFNAHLCFFPSSLVNSVHRPHKPAEKAGRAVVANAITYQHLIPPDDAPTACAAIFRLFTRHCHRISLSHWHGQVFPLRGHGLRVVHKACDLVGADRSQRLGAVIATEREQALDVGRVEPSLLDAGAIHD